MPVLSTIAAAAALSTKPKVSFDSVSYTSAGSYSWTVPDGVYEISAVCIGGGGGGAGSGSNTAGGGGGGGGGLSYSNNISVVPGSTLTIDVGAGGNGGGIETNGSAGGDSSVKLGLTTLVLAKGGSGGSYAGGGGAGGSSSAGVTTGSDSGKYSGGAGGTSKTGSTAGDPGGGGGAGGYSSDGGAGGGGGTAFTPPRGSPDGGGGGSHDESDDGAGGGGGVGLLGSGMPGAAALSAGSGAGNGGGGRGGSGGSNGVSRDGASDAGGGGGAYGGGGGGAGFDSNQSGGAGASGAVAIKWSFSNTYTKPTIVASHNGTYTSSSSTISYNISSVSIGTADASRRVVICVTWNSLNYDATLNSATINSVSATILKTSSAAGQERSAIIYASVSTGTSVTVNLTFNTTINYGVTITSYSLYGGSGLQPSTGYANHNGDGSSSYSTSVTVEPGDIVIGVLGTGANSVGDWTGLYKMVGYTFTASLSTQSYSSAFFRATTSGSLSVSTTGTTYGILSIATFR